MSYKKFVPRRNIEVGQRLKDWAIQNNLANLARALGMKPQQV
jgi:hypothetical protein